MKYGYLTAQKAADAVPGTSYCTWRRWVKDGAVPTIKVGRNTLINVDEALRILTVPPRSTPDMSAGT